jgi:hypothetical protein
MIDLVQDPKMDSPDAMSFWIFYEKSNLSVRARQSQSATVQRVGEQALSRYTIEKRNDYKKPTILSS